ncbi:uncharacterized protein SCODWIG_00649 [Saccharomycodes ludwigii]|uniref:Uncharacterized protein n=1 Tax=Saccharomycodes ludwigii TaxID=36035 RepID=A0A376B2I4_9ASCO|nr:hypothetical protein SCDLUD_003812 [Saccharomycodes ludwigii]KAH3899535.1 hypothetical protein SCDLUD_003812 [Saccharomycodes ludwigii]SSD58888.1 uncharacterized protein SCODWIG_00649 [Saccharomycodes ludwigii]
MDFIKLLKSTELHVKDDLFNNNGKPTLEDSIINFLEGLTNIFDQIYFLKTIGILKEQSFLYRKVYKSQATLKLWLISLILTLRKNLSKLVNLLRLRFRLTNEFNKYIQKQQDGNLNVLLNEKLAKQLKLITKHIKIFLWDLLETLSYLILVIIDLFNPTFLRPGFKTFFERLTTFISVSRFAYNVLYS